MLSNDIFIREAYPDEKEAILTLTLEANAEYAATLPAAFWTVYRQRLIDTLENPGQVTHLVAVENENIIGSVLLSPTGVKGNRGVVERAGWPYVRLMAVSPLARGRGVGAALISECIRLARSWGAPAVGLHTIDVMKPAMRMYEKTGFVRMPQLDIQVGEVLLIGYRYDLPQ